MTDSDMNNATAQSKGTHKPSEKGRNNADILAGEEFVLIGPPSKWTSDVLDCLGVRFSIRKTFNLMNYLKQKTRQSWTTQHQKGTDLVWSVRSNSSV